MSLSYCGKYKDAGMRMTKRIRMTGRCERCHKENYNGGRNCKPCREIKLALHKEKGSLQRK